MTTNQTAGKKGGKRTVVRMGMKEQLRLTDTLRACQEQFRQECPPHRDAADHLSERCGFPVTVSQLLRAMEATGVTWKVKKKTPTKWYFATQIQVLREFALTVCEKLDIPPPPELIALKNAAKFLDNSSANGNGVVGNGSETNGSGIYCGGERA